MPAPRRARGLLAEANDSLGRRHRRPGNVEALNETSAGGDEPVGPKYSIRGGEPINWDPQGAKTRCALREIRDLQAGR